MLTMFIFIWSGRGILVALVGFMALMLYIIAGSVLGLNTDHLTLADAALAMIIAVICFAPLWFYGKKRSAIVRELTDTETGEKIVIRNRDTLFWIPMQYWAIIGPVALLLLLILAAT
jgi:hypothetical protein